MLSDVLSVPGYDIERSVILATDEQLAAEPASLLVMNLCQHKPYSLVHDYRYRNQSGYSSDGKIHTYFPKGFGRYRSLQRGARSHARWQDHWHRQDQAQAAHSERQRSLGCL